MVTRGWVEDGLVEPAQREALRDWLVANAGPRRSGFLDVLLPGLVAVGTWLVTGSTLVLTLFTGGWLEEHPGQVLVVLALVQGLVGAAAWLASVPAVAHGVWAAGWLVLACGVGVLVGEGTPSPLLVAVVGAALYAVPGVAAFLARMPGLAWSGAVAGLFTLGASLDAGLDPVTAGLVVACLAVTGALAAGQALAPERFDVVQVLVPTPTLVALTALVGWGFDLGTRDWGWLASGGMAAGWATLLLAAAAVSRSRWALGSSLVAWAVAESCVLFQVGSPLLAAGVLGAEGLLVLGLAGAWILARAGRERRPR